MAHSQVQEAPLLALTIRKLIHELTCIFIVSKHSKILFHFISESYADNMQCDYTIHVSRGSSVTLQLIDISMEITPDCTYDYVAVSKSVDNKYQHRVENIVLIFFCSDSRWAQCSIASNWILLSCGANYFTRIHFEWGVRSIRFGYQHKCTWFWIEVLGK